MLEGIIALITATFLLLGSPGPATLALAATGATYGVKKGVDFLLGLLAGLSVAIICAMVGLASVFSVFPELQLAFQVIGALYICFLAWKIATAPVLGIQSASPGDSPGFRDGFILNLINPKAYAAFLSLFSQFLLPHPDVFVRYLFTGLCCFIVVTVIDVFWLLFGGALRPVFAKPKQARTIRVVFAILMLVAVAYAFI